MRKGFFILILPFTAAIILPIFHARAEGSITNELERVKGFEDYQKYLKEFDQERESGAKEVGKTREEWDAQLAAQIPEFKAEKSKEAKALTESSPEYLEDLKEKEKENKESRLEAEQYSAQKKKEEAGYVNLLSEAKEYGLTPEPYRVDWRKRSLYGGSPTALAGGGHSGRGRPSSGFTRPTDFGGPATDLNSPPPPPPPVEGRFDSNTGPDFFEPDIPPPPMPEGFDEDIPPPVFDEPISNF